MKRWREALIEKSIVNNVLQNFLNQVGSGGEPNETKFTVEKLKNNDNNVEKYFSRFKRYEKKVCFQINNNLGEFSDLIKIERNIDEMFGHFMRDQFENILDNDIISVAIANDDLDKGNVFIPPFRKKDFNEQCFLNSIYSVSQSNKTFLLNGPLYISINVTKY
jgi:hypothetical protein